MALFRDRIAPVLVDHLMGRAVSTARRERLVPRASGRVLEVGIGTGQNLPWYGPGVQSLLAVDPAWNLQPKAIERARALGREVEFLVQPCEKLALPEHSIDTVVMTWTLCSIRDPHAALAALRRALVPGGRLLFIEHGRADDRDTARRQDRLDPAWSRLTSNCHLNRPIESLIRSAGFEVQEIERSFDPGPRILGFHYQGVATS